MKFSCFILLPLVATLQSAAARPSLAKRDTCAQYESQPAGPYTLYQNLWGEAGATSGWQCAGVDYQSGDIVSWHTAWDWQGNPSGVKSYTNLELQFDPKQLSSISSIPTTWDWSYAGSNIDADVSYDIFTSDSSNGATAFEIMIWLAAIGGAGPISSTGSPIATVYIADTNWELFEGSNGAWKVFSFVSQSEQTSFNADMLDFFNYLIQNQGLPSNQYVSGIASGTEPFTGSNAQLTTSGYSIMVD